jgi:hypothetical protein
LPETLKNSICENDRIEDLLIGLFLAVIIIGITQSAGLPEILKDFITKPLLLPKYFLNVFW